MSASLGLRMMTLGSIVQATQIGSATPFCTWATASRMALDPRCCNVTHIASVVTLRLASSLTILCLQAWLSSRYVLVGATQWTDMQASLFCPTYRACAERAMLSRHKRTRRMWVNGLACLINRMHSPASGRSNLRWYGEAKAKECDPGGYLDLESKGLTKRAA